MADHPPSQRFFACVDRFLIRKETRKAALSLLIDLVQAQPPRMHVIMQTSLFANILRCLQHDTSTSVVSSALTLLLMILPSIPNSLGPHLSVLFNIYARLLFWSRDRTDLGDSGEADAPVVAGWDVLPPSPDDGQNIPRLINLFTVLYGLFPINFMEYIRKPQRYLRHFDASRTDDVEVEATEIRQKSEPFRQCHIIHPNFYTTTIESEKTDFGRWQKSEPADITAECMALCLATESGGENFGRASSLAVAAALRGDAGSYDGTLGGLGSLPRQDASAALLSGSMPVEGWRGNIPGSPALSHCSAQMVPPSLAPDAAPSWPASARESAQPSTVASPFLAAHAAGSPAAKAQQLQDMIHHNRAIKLSLDQSLPNDSIPSLSLSHAESTVAAAAAAAAAATATETAASTTADADRAPSDALQHVAYLQRQITLLQNDLRFERYLRQQHVAHIGSLRRKQLGELETEADMQKLLLSNRNMKHRIEEAKKGEMQARRESEKSRAMSKKWESDMYSKLRAAKDDVKRGAAERDTLQRELEQSKDECRRLKQILCAAEARELTSRQHWETAQGELARVEALKREVERLGRVGEKTGDGGEGNGDGGKETGGGGEGIGDGGEEPGDGDGAILQGDAPGDLPPTASLATQLESLRLALAAREYDMQQMRASYDAQVAQLKAQILDPANSDAHGNRPSRPDPDVADVRLFYDQALTTSAARLAEVQGQYDALSRRHTAVQAELLDARVAGGARMGSSPAASDYESSAVPSPTGRRPSRARTFTDVEAADNGSLAIAAAAAAHAQGRPSRSATNSPTLSGIGGLHAAASWGLDGGVPLAGDARYSARGEFEGGVGGGAQGGVGETNEG
jgi:hypothetical protein